MGRRKIVRGEQEHALRARRVLRTGFIRRPNLQMSPTKQDFYAPQFERTLLWNDPDVGISWPFEGEPILSDKDRAGTF